MSEFRRSVWRQLDPSAYEHPGLSPANKLVVALILIASMAAILETEPLIERALPRTFEFLEQGFACAFLVEYAARLWSASENPRFAGFGGRLRYALTPAALIDLVVVLPSLLTPGTSNVMLLRIFRLLRILRLARLGRFSTAMQHLSEAVTERKEELALSFFIAMIVLIFSASAMYMLESEAQPQVFGSIPRALWWSVCALTTIGYGDAVPHTALGKICAGLTSIAGIGLIAMPTGILAAAFSDAFRRGSRMQHPYPRQGAEAVRVGPAAMDGAR
jgi:voltage-gated potassium channel